MQILYMYMCCTICTGEFNDPLHGGLQLSELLLRAMGERERKRDGVG